MREIIFSFVVKSIGMAYTVILYFIDMIVVIKVNSNSNSIMRWCWWWWWLPQLVEVVVMIQAARLRVIVLMSCIVMTVSCDDAVLIKVLIAQLEVCAVILPISEKLLKWKPWQIMSACNSQVIRVLQDESSSKILFCMAYLSMIFLWWMILFVRLTAWGKQKCFFDVKWFGAVLHYNGSRISVTLKHYCFKTLLVSFFFKQTIPTSTPEMAAVK